MLAPLDNDTVFKKAFTDKIVFTQFVKDIFGVKVQVAKIETEKKFTPPVGHIDFKIDIYAETTDHRFIIEIQKIDYDHNFDRFLHYFMMVIAEQQRSAKSYKINQKVLAAVILSRPYKLDKRGDGIQESVMVLDIDPRNLKDEKIAIWGHRLFFLNANPKYRRAYSPKPYRDWLDLFYASMSQKERYTLNLHNRGISKAVDIIDEAHIDPAMLHEIKITAGKKIVLKQEYEEGKAEGEHKKQLEVARRMKQKGYPAKDIADMTGLTEKEIEKM